MIEKDFPNNPAARGRSTLNTFALTLEQDGVYVTFEMTGAFLDDVKPSALKKIINKKMREPIKNAQNDET